MSRLQAAAQDKDNKNQKQESSGEKTSQGQTLSVGGDRSQDFLDASAPLASGGQLSSISITNTFSGLAGALRKNNSWGSELGKMISY